MKIYCIIILSIYIFNVSLLSLQDGNTALILASENGHTYVVQVLLAAEANTDTTDKVSICIVSYIIVLSLWCSVYY